MLTHGCFKRLYSNTMEINQEFYLEAQAFVEAQLSPTVVIYPLPSGYGHTSFRAPAIYVSLPSEPSADHIKSVCALFHEFGHWLDMELWLENNGQGGDSRLCAIKYNDHLQKIGVLQTPGRAVIKNAVLQNERDARKYGLEGLEVSGHVHRGLKAFDEEKSSPKGWLIAQYELFSDEMFESYENNAV